MAELTQILVYTMIYLFPLGMIGIYYLVDRQFMPRIQRMRGRIMVKRLQPNGRFKTFYSKPVIENVTEIVKKKITDKETGKVHEIEEEIPVSGGFIEHKGERLQFFATSDTLYDDFNTKVAYYDVEGNQIMINQLRRIMPAISSKLIDHLVTRTWNAGRAAMFGEKKNIFIFVAIAAGAAIFANLLIFLLFTEFDKLIVACGG